MKPFSKDELAVVGRAMAKATRRKWKARYYPDTDTVGVSVRGVYFGLAFTVAEIRRGVRWLTKAAKVRLEIAEVSSCEAGHYPKKERA